MIYSDAPLQTAELAAGQLPKERHILNWPECMPKLLLTFVWIRKSHLRTQRVCGRRLGKTLHFATKRGAVGSKFRLVGLIFGIVAFAVNTCATAANYPAHSGSSPVSFDDIEPPSGEFNVNDTDSADLDLYQFRDSRQFQIRVSIPNARFIGNIEDALSKGVVSGTAKIFVPAFDVDANTFPVFDCDGDGIPESFNPEVNEVYLNGEMIGNLTGDNNIWKFNDTFTVPIEKINFPSNPGDVAHNVIEVAIDTANKTMPLSGGGSGCAVWATEIDWVAIKFDTARPIFLLAGLFGSTAAFESSGYVSEIQQSVGVHADVLGHSLTQFGLLSCQSGNFPALNAHAEEFVEQLTEFSQEYGTANIHLVGHSMGGLDGRMVLKKAAEAPIRIPVGTMGGQDVFEELKIESLITHGTPHRGTLVADYLQSQSAFTTIFPDLCELTTTKWKLANRALNQLYGAKLATIGGDADKSGDGTLDAGELSGNQISFLGLGNFLYDLLKNHSDIQYSTEVIPGPMGPIIVTTASPVADTTPNLNDTQVTIESANGPPVSNGAMTLAGPIGKNHGTIIDSFSQSFAVGIGKSALGWGDLK